MLVEVLKYSQTPSDMHYYGKLQGGGKKWILKA